MSRYVHLFFVAFRAVSDDFEAEHHFLHARSDEWNPQTIRMKRTCTSCLIIVVGFPHFTYCNFVFICFSTSERIASRKKR